MVDPKVAGEILREHFDTVTPEEFIRRYKKYVLKGEDTLTPPVDTTKAPPPLLRQRYAWPLALTACLSTADTGQCGAVSDIVESVCQELQIYLRRPDKASGERVVGIDRKRALKRDLIVHVGNLHDGELDFALDALLPVVVVARGETTASWITPGIAALELTVNYSDLDCLETEFRERLTEIRPVLEQRKFAFADFDKRLVGDKVRVTRQNHMLTREKVAAHSGGLLSVERIREIELGTDRATNPTLAELRALAALLKTTVADLTEADLNERVVALRREGMLKTTSLTE